MNDNGNYRIRFLVIVSYGEGESSEEYLASFGGFCESKGLSSDDDCSLTNRIGCGREPYIR